jgi:hypothetical protein
LQLDGQDAEALVIVICSVKGDACHSGPLRKGLDGLEMKRVVQEELPYNLNVRILRSDLKEELASLIL